MKFVDFFERKKIPTCDLLSSIYRNLHLLTTTVNGESKIDEMLGAPFWDSDYDIHLTNDLRREIITTGMKQQIDRYEKRITNVDVVVNVKLANMMYNGAEIQRRKVEIIISGDILRSMEPFTFQTGFFIGPLTMD